ILSTPWDGQSDCSITWQPGAVGTRTVPVCHGTAGGSSVILGLCDYGNDCSRSCLNPAGCPWQRCEPVPICMNDGQHSPFAIVVANPNKVDSVDVTLSIATGMAQTVTVAAGQTRALFPQQMGFPDQSLSWSGLTRQAYRLISTRPIVAYQFNPLE